jgi:hypothetical protein
LSETIDGGDEVASAILVDGDDAAFRVDEVPEEQQAPGRPGLLLLVAAEAQPAEDFPGDAHVLLALLLRVGHDEEVVHVHRAVDADGREELHHFT